MRYTIELEIRAVLFGVDESVIGKLKIGNKYQIRKENIINNDYFRLFGYNNSTMFDIYYNASIDEDDSTEVAVLYKKIRFLSPKIKMIPKKGCYMNGKEYTEYLNDIELKEYHYLNDKIKVIRLFSDNSFNINEVFTSIKVYNGKKIVLPTIISRYPLSEKILGCYNKLSLTDDKDANRINKFIKNIDLKSFENKYEKNSLKNALFLYDQTYTAPTSSLRFMVGVIAIESLMIDKDDRGELTYKFYRNTAMLLSNNILEYEKLKTKLKKIYKYRSQFVHNGFVEEVDYKIIKDVRDILRNIIFKLNKLDIDKNELLKQLEIKGLKK